MTLIYNNIYFHIFIVFFLIDLFISITNKKKVIKLKKTAVSDKDFVIYLHENLKNNNILFSYFLVIIYILVTILPFFILRVNGLGVSYDVINITHLSKENLYTLLCFILFVIYLFKICNSIIYPYIIKIHLYLLYTYKNYYDYIYNSFITKNLLEDYFYKIFRFFYLSSVSNKDFIEEYRTFKTISKIYKKHSEQKNEYFFYLYIRCFLNKNYILKTFCYILSTICHKLHFHVYRFFYFVPHSIVILCLAYDLIQGYIFYIFYALFYFYLTNFIKKIKKFYKEKDPVCDGILSDYFYSNKHLYDAFTDSVNKESYDILSLKYHKISKILSNKKNIINYILVDYKVYYIISPIYTINEKILMKIYKRLHILFLLSLLNFYIIYHNKYLLIIYNIEISISFITVMLLMLLYMIHRKIAQETSDKWAENLKPKMYYNIISTLYIIMISYLVVKNKVDINMSEILLNIKDIIIIKENFTFKEKYNYILICINKLKDANINDNSLLSELLEEYRNNYDKVIKMTLNEIKLDIINKYTEMLTMKSKINLENNNSLWQKIIKIFRIK